MHKLLEVIHRGILKGLNENNIELLSDLDNDIDQLDSIQTKNINTKIDYCLILAANKHKYVDLGLPSGNLWAEYNVGASEGSRRGGSYQWCNDIDMQPYTTEPLSQFSFTFTTHLVNGENPKALNFKIPAEFNFDICTAVMGGKWEMPTKQDYLELINNCKIEYNTDEEECIFIGPNGNTLIFPTAEVHMKAYTYEGFKIADDDAAYMGSYWTRDINANNEPYMFTFNLYDETVYMCTSCDDDYCTQARAVLKLSNKKDIHENTLNILSDIDDTFVEDIDIPCKNINNKIHALYKYFPTTKEELIEIIKAEVEEKGWRCSLNHIDVSRITDMSYLFGDNLINIGYNLEKFNGNISRWNVSNVINMEGMFLHNVDFNRDISKWDVSNVKNMEAMFCDAELFNQPIGDWDVSNVTNMSSMFCHAHSFNHPIGNWNVSNVDDMGSIFYEANSFNQDLSKWKFKTKPHMFYNCPIKEEYKPTEI